MARLKALRLAKEAAEPAHPAATVKKPRGKSAKKSGAKSAGARRLAVLSAERRAQDLTLYTGAGHSIIDRVFVAAS